MKPLALGPGNWTPALRALAIELMEVLLSRPAAAAITNPVRPNSVTFRTIGDRICRNKYTDLGEWKADFDGIIRSARTSKDDFDHIICDELDRWFTKRYEELRRLSEFKFKDALDEVVAEMQKIRDEIANANP